MGIFIGDTAPSKIFVGGSEVASVRAGDTKVRPTVPTYRTFTISREEKSDMSSGWTYSDDAAGLTAGSTVFDEFFGYSGIQLDTNGTEVSEVTQEDSGGAGKLDITQLGTIATGNNVMIKFPVRGIKMTKSGSTVTLSITEELDKDGYQYYAFQTGTLANPGTPKDAFYLGAYKANIQGSSLSNYIIRSLPSTSPQAGTHAMSQFCTYAKRNGSGYNIIGFYQRMYINALYMMKYGNPDSQTVVGKGVVSGSKVNTGGTKNQTDATYGTSSTSSQIKLFGLEDRWGNVEEFVGGAYTDSSKQLCTMLTGWTGTVTSGGEGTGITITTSSGSNLSAIAGDNKAMFSPVGTVSNSNYNTYYTDYVYVRTSRLPYFGGSYSSTGNKGGVFSVSFNNTAGDALSTGGTRIMYMNGLT